MPYLTWFTCRPNVRLLLCSRDVSAVGTWSPFPEWRCARGSDSNSANRCLRNSSMCCCLIMKSWEYLGSITNGPPFLSLPFFCKRLFVSVWWRWPAPDENCRWLWRLKEGERWSISLHTLYAISLDFVQRGKQQQLTKFSRNRNWKPAAYYYYYILSETQSTQIINE